MTAINALGISTQDVNVLEYVQLPTPRELRAEYPVSSVHYAQVVDHRIAIQDILDGKSNRLMVVAGPCSMRNHAETMQFAHCLAELVPQYPLFQFVMRLCPDKPRTGIGWTGLASDPNLDGSYDMVRGAREMCRIFADVTKLGLATSTEVLGPFSIQYIARILSLAWIGARTVTDPLARHTASALSMPVGFKNEVNGDLDGALHAIHTANHPQHFRGMDDDGRVAGVRSRGNPYGHLILRGGSKPNYAKEYVSNTASILTAKGLRNRLLIDCSHGNSGKDHRMQPHVALDVTGQIFNGQSCIAGVMLEVDLEQGSQKTMLGQPGYQAGVSVTDSCLAIKDAKELISEMYRILY